MARIAVIALALAALAGCIDPPQDPDGRDAQPVAGDATMTASETSTEKSELCTEGLDLGSEDRFCAERVVTVTGRLSGIARLDVGLETFNGAILVEGSNDDAWGLTAILRARGATAEDAMTALDDIGFRWAHEDARGHFVEVVAEHDGSTESRSASIELSMPRAVVMQLAAATSNGDVTMDGGRADALALTTSNGDIHASGEASQVALTTSNGEIDAALTPLGAGRWSLVTSNGEIALAVPEGPTFGYEMEGTTSNGEVDFSLRDGTKGPCPQGSEYYTPPCNHRTFETSDFARRDVRVSVELVTSNGAINVGPK